jgi:DnaJ-class molecular chaperone
MDHPAGYGEATCDKCDGDREITCPKCNGEGQVEGTGTLG